ncbi:MAG: DUF1559 domain-containing protein [Planctomycetota bacterium]|nr:DUF1559 domain-containing protein [Planctomycetota bacterium]
MLRTQIMIGCQKTLLACLVVGHLFLVGCGGTSQDDMRRHAIRRRPAEEESDVASLDAPQKTAASPKTDASLESAAKVPIGNRAASEPSPRQPTTDDEQASSNDAVATRPNAIPSAAPPAEPLSTAERRERTASNLKRIGEAWRAYLKQEQHFPGPVTNLTKQPLLSWRVQLLPSLGLQSLYDAFHLDEAWDSPHNVALLDKIPEVFQSPERFDAKTNYLALSLGGTTVYQERRTVLESNVEDGMENTLALVEVDDEQAVPWTKPAEYSLSMATPLKSLGNLRENGLFVVWSDGKASWLDGSADPKLFAKACTIDSGDGFSGSQIARDLAAGIAIPVEPSTESAPDAMIATVPEPAATDAVPTTSGTQRPTLSDAQASFKSKAGGQPQSSFRRAPIPSASDLKIARDLLRELYQEDYASAKTEPERLQLARKMLDRLPDLGGDFAGQYALLEIAKQISIRAGKVDVALDASDQMAARFELKEDALLATFEKLTRTAKDRGDQDRLVEEADDAFDDFVLAGQYEAAERISQLAVSVAKKGDDEDAVDKFTARRNWAGQAKDLHQAAEEGLAALEKNPTDPRANGDVGKFLCLIKGDWDNGLVILANGNDRSLKRLAEMELGNPSDAMQQLELADLWWREAESELPAFKATLQSRAKYWYEQSLSGLPAGLVRIRVERRIEEIGKLSA